VVCLTAVAACGRIAFDPLQNGDGGAGMTGDVPDGATSARRPWVIGDLGFIARWDGTSFQQYASPNNTAEFTDLYVASDNDAWALGTAGLAKWNGSVWSSVTSPITGQLSAIWGRAGNDLWIASQTGNISHWDGFGWTTQPAQVAAYNGISGTVTDVFAVGDLGRVSHYNGSVWSAENSVLTNDAEDTRALGNEIYAVGEHATLFHRDANANWSTTAAVISDRWLRDILPFAPDDIYIVGEFASIYHFDGSNWTNVGPALSTTIELWSISGVPDDIWVCGDQGTVLHFDGVSWSQPSSGTTLTLDDIGY